MPPVLRAATLSGPQNHSGDVETKEVRQLETVVRGLRRIRALEAHGGEKALEEARAIRRRLPADAELEEPDTQRRLDEARRRLRFRRSQAWRDWVKGNLASRARSVFGWVKRIQPIVREETLNWGRDDCPMGLGDRTRKGIEEWSSFWTSGPDEGWEDLRGPPLGTYHQSANSSGDPTDVKP